MSDPVGFLAPLGALRSPTLPESLLIGPPPSALLGLGALRKDIHFSGPGQIVGTVKEKGVPNIPLVRRVLLYSETTRLLVAEVWSSPNGDYRFETLDPVQRYFVIAFDHTQLYSAVVADNLVPELIA